MDPAALAELEGIAAIFGDTGEVSICGPDGALAESALEDATHCVMRVACGEQELSVRVGLEGYPAAWPELSCEQGETLLQSVREQLFQGDPSECLLELQGALEDAFRDGLPIESESAADSAAESESSDESLGSAHSEDYEDLKEAVLSVTEPRLTHEQFDQWVRAHSPAVRESEELGPTGREIWLEMLGKRQA